jgi:hypothetical protein
MTRPDPLAALLLLRRIEVEAARQRAAEAADKVRRVEGVLRKLHSDAAVEASGANPASFADWMPEVRVKLARLQAQREGDEAGLAVARQDVATAQLAQKLAREVQAQAMKKQRKQQMAKDEARLDDTVMAAKRGE